MIKWFTIFFSLLLLSCKTTIYHLKGKYGEAVYEINRGSKIYFFQPGLEIVSKKKYDINNGIGYSFETPKIKIKRRNINQFEYHYLNEQSDSVVFIIDRAKTTNSKVFVIPKMLLGNSSYPCALNREQNNFNIEYQYFADTVFFNNQKADLDCYMFNAKLYKLNDTDFYSAKIYIEKSTLMVAGFEFPSCDSWIREKRVIDSYTISEIKRRLWFSKKSLWQ